MAVESRSFLPLGELLRAGLDLVGVARRCRLQCIDNCLLRERIRLAGHLDLEGRHCRVVGAARKLEVDGAASDVMCSHGCVPRFR